LWTPTKLFSEFLLVAIVVGWLAFMVLDPLMERHDATRRPAQAARRSDAPRRNALLLGRPASLLGLAIGVTIVKQLVHHGLTHGEGLGWLAWSLAFLIASVPTYAWIHSAGHGDLKASVVGAIAGGATAGLGMFGSQLLMEMPLRLANVHASASALQWGLCGYAIGRAIDRGKWKRLWLRVAAVASITALAADVALSLFLGFEWLQFFQQLLMALGWGLALLLYPAGRPAGTPGAADA
jgi:hypothetical protein